MKKIFLPLSCLALQSCGGGEPTPREPDALDEAFDIINAEDEREIPPASYPECDNVWNGQKLSPCGVKRLEVALDACDAKVTVGVRLDPLSAGDSWIARAGRESMESVGERANRITKSGVIHEEISYALANGTPMIKAISCELSQEIKLVRTVSSLK